MRGCCICIVLREATSSLLWQSQVSCACSSCSSPWPCTAPLLSHQHVRAGMGTSSSTCMGRDGVPVPLLSPMWVVSPSLPAAAILPLSHFGSAAVAPPNDTEFRCSVSQIPALVFWAGLGRGGALTLHPRHNSPLRSFLCPAIRLEQGCLYSPVLQRWIKKAALSRGPGPRAAQSLLLMLGYCSWNALGDAFPLLRRAGFLFGFDVGNVLESVGSISAWGACAGKGGLVGAALGKLREFWSLLLAPGLSRSWVLCWVK